MTLATSDLAVLGAVAETLIPTDETPGAEASWARAFVERRVAAVPAEAAGFTALARHIDEQARGRHGRSFEQLDAGPREDVIASLHPTIADSEELPAQAREERRLLRVIASAFFKSDHVDPRDRTQPTGSEYEVAHAIATNVDRDMAMGIGAGDYARAWAAAGYGTPPGAPQRIEDISRAPDHDGTRNSSGD